jgi:hypothetical protein
MVDRRLHTETVHRRETEYDPRSVDGIPAVAHGKLA